MRRVSDFSRTDTLYIRRGSTVLLPFVALVFTYKDNYATGYAFRKIYQRLNNAMYIRSISWEEIPILLRILQSAPPHGHREWNFNCESELRTTLDNDRLSPDLDRWSIAFVDGDEAGYSLTEPELNIGRVIVGVATIAGNESLYAQLLEDGLSRARNIAGANQIEAHIAVRDNEPDYVRDLVLSMGFQPIRSVLKMRIAIECLTYKPQVCSELDEDFAIESLDISDRHQISELTDLHNACFKDSWGFSPNNVDEISTRALADAERCGCDPTLIVTDRDTNEMVAYIWMNYQDLSGRIEMVGVHPSKRGSGLGRKVFDAGVAHLIDLGAQTLSLDVDSVNVSARHIYESAGFQTYSEVMYYSIAIN